MYFFIGQHGLHIAGQGRHPVQLQRLQVGRAEHGVHAGQRQRLFLVDAFDPGVGVGAAHHIGVQHALEFNIIDIVAPALHETGVFLAFSLAAYAF